HGVAEPRLRQDDRHGHPRSPGGGKGPHAEAPGEGSLEGVKFLPYILKHLRRNWIRTGSTILGMAVCIFLFCTLRTVLKAMDDARELGSVTRLVTRHAVSLVYNLPLSYEGQTTQVKGVKRVASASWLGASLPSKKESQDKSAPDGGQPDSSKFFTNLAVED